MGGVATARTWVVAAVLTLVGPVAAQTTMLTGQVVDGAYLQPLAGASGGALGLVNVDFIREVTCQIAGSTCWYAQGCRRWCTGPQPSHDKTLAQLPSGV